MSPRPLIRRVGGRRADDADEAAIAEAQRRRKKLAGVNWDGAGGSTEPIVTFNSEHAEYVGDEDDGCYYQVAQGPGGWYVTVVVDCNTGSFCMDIVTDDGPYSSESKALQAGSDAAWTWCIDNEVTPED